MIVYKPEEVIAAKLVSSSLIESAPALEYQTGTTYPLNYEIGVIDGATGITSVYKSLQAGNIGHPPATSPTWWVKLGEVYREYLDYYGTYPMGSRAQNSTTHLVYQSIIDNAYGYPLDQVATPAWTEVGKKTYSEPLHWQTATAYGVGAVRRYRIYAPDPGGGPDVLISENFYRCTIAHTSGTLGPGLGPDAVNWTAANDYPRPHVIGLIYGLGVVVIDADGMAYRSNIDVNASPFSNKKGWVLIGTSNYWAAFDAESSSQSKASGSMVFTVAPGVVDAVALLNAEADLVQVVVREGLGGAVIYDQTSGVLSGSITDWWEYFHSDLFIDRRQILFNDLPLSANAHITVTLTGANIALGDCIFARGRELSLTGFGLQVGIKDFSVVTENEFGTTKFNRRRNRKRMDSREWIPKDSFNRTFNTLSDLTATPCVWVAGDIEYLNEALMLKAWYKDFTTEINGPYELYTSLKLEGIP